MYLNKQTFKSMNLQTKIKHKKLILMKMTQTKTKIGKYEIELVFIRMKRLLGRQVDREPEKD